jgi:hypothetical protein
MVTTSVGMLNRLKQQQAGRTEQAETTTVLKQTQGNNHH